MKLQPTRHLFHAGRLRPKLRHVCTQGNHVGRLIETEAFEAAGGMWATLGNCSHCGSTIDRSQIRVAS